MTQVASGELAGKVAVVTGAGSGIGQGIALGFLREGASVVIADIDLEGAEATGRLAAAEGLADQVTIEATDVTCEDDVARAVAAAQHIFGRIDIMINNAGGSGALDPLLDIDVDDFEKTCALLVRSVFLGIKHAGRAFRNQGGGGVIISTASIAARVGGCSPSLYAAAKAAVVQMSAMAAIELAPLRVRVNSVSPGAIMVPGFAKSGITAERLAQLQPWPEAGTPDDVAAAMIFLASDRCRFATGSDFVIDGGLVAQGPRLMQRLYGSIGS